MRKLIPLFAILALVGCKKDQTPVPVEPAPLTKWDILPGDYKVYDTLGNFLYDMQIANSTGTNIYGGREDTMQFINFDGNFTFKKLQFQGSQYVNKVYIGSLTAAHDSIDNRWDIFDFGCYAYDVFHNDTVLFKFEKHNTPYWMNDGTSYYHAIEKHIAVKQH